MSQMTDDVTVLDAGNPTPTEGRAACCTSTIAATRVQPEE
ncbi:geopeptide [Geobacter sulfurreducens]|nr:geopeptide [Geobacter sulfurreducens]